MDVDTQAADVLERLRREGAEVAPHHKEDAKAYFQEALEEMSERTSGLDPARWAPRLAAKAARSYAAHRLAVGALSQALLAEHERRYRTWKGRGRVLQHRHSRESGDDEYTTPYEDYVNEYGRIHPRDTLREVEDS